MMATRSPRVKRRTDSGFASYERHDSGWSGDESSIKPSSQPCSHHQSTTPPVPSRTTQSTARRPSTRRACTSSAIEQVKDARSRSSSKSVKSETRRQSFQQGTNSIRSERGAIGSPSARLSPQAIEEILAKHERSCAVFRSSEDTEKGAARAARTSFETTSTPQSPQVKESYMFRHPSELTSQKTSFSETNLVYPDGVPDQDAFDPTVPTVIHWTSPDRLREQYAAIDQSRRGIRGLLRKLTPRWFSQSSNASFYDSRKGSDAGSVRRYRLDIPEDDEKAMYIEAEAPRRRLGMRRVMTGF